MSLVINTDSNILDQQVHIGLMSCAESLGMQNAQFPQKSNLVFRATWLAEHPMLLCYGRSLVTNFSSLQHSLLQNSKLTFLTVWSDSKTFADIVLFLELNRTKYNLNISRFIDSTKETMCNLLSEPLFVC